jgi:hypothetical protein
VIVKMRSKDGAMEGAAETRGERLPGRVSGAPWAGGHRTALVDILKPDWLEQSKADCWNSRLGNASDDQMIDQNALAAWNRLTKAGIRIPCARLCRRLPLIASNGSLAGPVTDL